MLGGYDGWRSRGEGWSKENLMLFPTRIYSDLHIRIRLIITKGTHNSCKGSVDTPHTSVDTMLQALRQKMKKWSSSVDTRSSSVDTRPSSQRTLSTVLYRVSTLDEVVSTLETLPREAILPVCDSVSTHPMGRSTHSENFLT
ncbi:hypothetical protein Taro_023842 [Colocasia esculenta]|uniref:Uncharacterized protein n=1 Tax=Colocasia esculenta TaxID=4460 RepID=A0A843V572_COLES|nr:hypothetical protein [Colocasia esculenta]